MAYVISVVGAGGKTTICYKLAKEYLDKGYKVCVTTTTKMWNNIQNTEPNFLDKIDNTKVYTVCNAIGEKLAPLKNDELAKVLDMFDYVIIEADGSKSMPLKIPDYSFEPKIIDSTNEILIVKNYRALRRKIGAVCHRYNELKDKLNSDLNIKTTFDTIVTNEIIDGIFDLYYLKYLKDKYSNIKIDVIDNDISNSRNYEKYKKIVFSLCASGFSKRFNGNKLLAEISGKKMYQIMLDKLVNAKTLLQQKLKNDNKYQELNIELACVTQYDEIINDNKYSKLVSFIKNDNPDLGLSNSLKLTINNYYDYDGVMFTNSDLPLLSEFEICNFMFYMLCSNNDIGSMYTDKPVNPAFFEKKYFDEINAIDGDTGASALLKKYKMQTYKYFIDTFQMQDIDTKEDLLNLGKL